MMIYIQQTDTGYATSPWVFKFMERDFNFNNVELDFVK